MKIAIFTDCFDQVNGVAHTMRKLAQYGQQRGKEIDFFTHSFGGDSLESRGSVRILRFGHRLPFRYYPDLAFDLLPLRKLLWKEKPAKNYSLVHVTTPGSMGLNGLAMACRHHLPRVGSYHTALPQYLRSRVEGLLSRRWKAAQWAGQQAEAGVWFVQKWFYGKCHMLLAPSRPMIEDLQSRFNRAWRLFSRGVDAERFHPAKAQKRQPVTALYVGRLAVEKNLDMLVDIFASHRNAKLRFVGDGPHRKTLEQLLPDAEFSGFLEGEALSEAYASASFLVFPSKTDTFGNVVLEAMASGLPVIVTDQMGPKDLVRHGENGFIARDNMEFASYANRLVMDYFMRKHMGEEARRFAERCSWEAVFDTLFDNYAEVAAMTQEQSNAHILGLSAGVMENLG